MGHSSRAPESHGISMPSPASEQELAIFVAPEDPVKLAVLTLTNATGMRQRISVFGYVEWCLGPPRAGERRFVVTEMDDATGVMLARNAYNADFSGSVAFWRATETPRSHTGDRGEFVGRNRTSSAPAALFREQLAGRTGAGLDPCGALQLALDIEPGESRSVAFVLGQGRDRSHAIELAARYASWRRRRPRSPPSSACGTTCSAPSRSARPTIRSISSSIAGCSIRP